MRHFVMYLAVALLWMAAGILQIIDRSSPILWGTTFMTSAVWLALSICQYRCVKKGKPDEDTVKRFFTVAVVIVAVVCTAGVIMTLV